jgi:hypothetical protein
MGVSCRVILAEFQRGPRLGGSDRALLPRRSPRALVAICATPRGRIRTRSGSVVGIERTREIHSNNYALWARCNAVLVELHGEVRACYASRYGCLRSAARRSAQGRAPCNAASSLLNGCSSRILEAEGLGIAGEAPRPGHSGCLRRGGISPTSRHKHQCYDSNGRIFHVNTLLRVSLKPEGNDPRRPDSQTFVPPEQWQKIRATICKHLKQFHTFQ